MRIDLINKWWNFDTKRTQKKFSFHLLDIRKLCFFLSKILISKEKLHAVKENVQIATFCKKVNFSQWLVILTFHYVSETKLLLNIDVIILKDLNIARRFEICWNYHEIVIRFAFKISCINKNVTCIFFLENTNTITVWHINCVRLHVNWKLYNICEFIEIERETWKYWTRNYIIELKMRYELNHRIV